MKTDTQHLDYLISQYVDGCLEGTNKKSLEQRMLNDPQARGLYQEHRDVQDVLDDWGNRIPMINWDEFDKTLAGRLENETVGGQRVTVFRRWAKPFSIAASLFVAASMGYGWHAYSTRVMHSHSVGETAKAFTGSSRAVALEGPTVSSRGSLMKVRVDETPDAGTSPLAANNVAISGPGNLEASEALKASVAFGLPSVGQTVKQDLMPNAASSVHVAQATPIAPAKAEEKDAMPMPPAFP